MDSATTVGRVTQYVLITQAVTGDATIYETNISKGFTVNPEATYGQIDTASRAIATLSTNAYRDTDLITKISVTEVLAG